MLILHLLIVVHLDTRISGGGDIHALCSLCQKMFKIATFGRKIREGKEVHALSKVWPIVLRSWISADFERSILGTATTSASTATPGRARSAYLASLASRGVLGIGSMGLYLMRHIVAVGLSLHSGHHVHLIHLGCSGSNVHHGWASGTHARRALIVHRATTSIVVRRHTAPVWCTAKGMLWRVGHLVLLVRASVAATSATTATLHIASTRTGTCRKRGIAGFAMDRLR